MVLIIKNGVDGEFVVGAKEGVDAERVEGGVVAKDFEVFAFSTVYFDDADCGGADDGAAACFLLGASYGEKEQWDSEEQEVGFLFHGLWCWGYNDLRRSSSATSSWMSTSRGLEPLEGPTMPAASSWSMMRPARLYPSWSLR